MISETRKDHLVPEGEEDMGELKKVLFKSL